MRFQYYAHLMLGNYPKKYVLKIIIKDIKETIIAIVIGCAALWVLYNLLAPQLVFQGANNTADFKSNWHVRPTYAQAADG